MSTWSLTRMDTPTGLAVTSYSRRVPVGRGVQSQSCTIVSDTWMTPVKLQVDCRASPKPRHVEAMSLETDRAICTTELKINVE